jgi:hypothetical protein
MGWIQDAARKSGTSVDALLVQLENVARDAALDPSVGPNLSSLPFAIRGPRDLFEEMLEILIGAAAIGISPVTAATVASTSST